MLVGIKQGAGVRAVERTVAPVAATLEDGDAFAGTRQLARDSSAARTRADDDVLRIQRSEASRFALNSVPGFHSGHVSVSATEYPTMNSSRRSSTAPVRSQSGLI